MRRKALLCVAKLIKAYFVYSPWSEWEVYKSIPRIPRIPRISKMIHCEVINILGARKVKISWLWLTESRVLHKRTWFTSLLGYILSSRTPFWGSRTIKKVKRCFNVVTTLWTWKQRCVDVKTTSCGRQNEVVCLLGWAT